MKVQGEKGVVGSQTEAPEKNDSDHRSEPYIQTVTGLPGFLVVITDLNGGRCWDEPDGHSRR